MTNRNKRNLSGSKGLCPDVMRVLEKLNRPLNFYLAIRLAKITPTTTTSATKRIRTERSIAFARPRTFGRGTMWIGCGAGFAGRLAGSGVGVLLRVRVIEACL
jgi:hypothetical protein